LRFKRIRPDNCLGDFETWNARFPKARAKNQALAYASLESEPLSYKDYQKKMFGKRELTMKGGPEPEDFDPRAIQGNTDRLNVAYGPFTHKVGLQLKKIWHVNHDITYSGGLTAEEIGTWRSQFGDEDVTIIECDESRYDCHQGEENERLYHQVELRCGSRTYPNVEDAIKGNALVRGWSSKGVKYSVEHTMTSGSPKTSVSNSYTNGVKTMKILRSLGHKPKVMIHGDDSISVIRGLLSPEQKQQLTDSIVRENLRLGFETKVKISNSWSDVEYCSSLFWPVEGGFVLGPKIGKRLPKIGFGLKKLKRPEVKGMMIGLELECGFVPVLGEFAQHQLKLLSDVEAVEHVDERKIYKSLPVNKHKRSEETEVFFRDRYSISSDAAVAQLRESLTGNLTDCVQFNLLDEFVKRDL